MLSAPGWLDAPMRQLLSGSALALALRILGGCLGLGYNILLARVVGVEGVGLYMLALMVATVAAMLGRVGLDNAMLRFIAAGAHDGDWTAVKGVFRRGCTYALLGSAASALLVWALAPWLATRVFAHPELLRPLRSMALAVVPAAFVWVVSAALRGLIRIRDAQIVQFVLVPGLGSLLLGLLAHAGRADVSGAVWTFAAANAFAVVVGLGFWRRAVRPAAGVRGEFDGVRLLRTGLPLLGVASMTVINGWIATTALGIFRTAGEVGLYNVALRVALLMSFVLTAFKGVAAPRFSALSSQGDRAGLSRVVVHSTRVMTAITLPMLLVFLLLPGPVLRVFGPDFASARPLLMILAAGQFFGVASGLVAQLLAMTGHERVLARVLSASVIVNVLLCTALVPLAGATGAAWATAASWVVTNVLALLAVRRALGIGAHALSRSAPVDLEA